MDTGAGVDAGDPEAAESALLVAAVAICVLKGLFDGIFGYRIDLAACTEIAFCGIEDALSSGAGCYGVD